ncbi:MAG: Gfo/Idh/MocA family oxidoreductase, partial [Armatimonadetes bacterium]|nr:Gfo/Idh/MocA family oxidoreductase [Armatimonadota bacterium]
MLTVGLIGAGAIAQAHLQAFVESDFVGAVKVADPSAAAREAAAREFGIIKAAYEDYRALLDDPEVAVIDICTPHYLHCQQAVEALEAGKHVITEKPMALSVAECDRMIAAAERAGKRLFVSLCQRMFPAHQRAAELIAEGVIGEPFMAVINVYGDEFARMNDPLSWKGDWQKAGGGALFDTGHHAIYMLQHFFGPASAVTAVVRRLRV